MKVLGPINENTDIVDKKYVDDAVSGIQSQVSAKKYWADIEVSGSSSKTSAPTLSPDFKFNVASNSVIGAAANKAIASPLAKYLWHDILSFGVNGHPTVSVSSDGGSTWAASTDETLQKKLFIQREDQTVTVLDDTRTAIRWQWYSTQFHACQASYLNIGFAYSAKQATFNILWETSTDGSTWTTSFKADGVKYTSSPYWFYLTTNWSNAYWARLTITRTSEAGTSANISGIKLLTPRWGNQGRGGEYEKPYSWDYLQNIFPRANNSSTLGTSTAKWNNVYATTFTGDLTGTANKATNDSDGNKISTTYVKAGALGDYYLKTEVNQALADLKSEILGEGIDEAYDTLLELSELINANQGSLSALGTLINGKLDKTTYEFNKELNLGGSGKVCIGKFPMYDSNITVTINSTTNTTYHGVLVIATQNINTSLGGTYKAVVYGDASNTLTSSIKIQYLNGSNVFAVYIDLPTYSKNLLHIQCSALKAAPTDIATTVTSIPSTATIVPTNALTTNFASKAVATTTTDGLMSAADKTKLTNLSKSDVGLSNVDNTADADKDVKSAWRAKGLTTGSGIEAPNGTIPPNLDYACSQIGVLGTYVTGPHVKFGLYAESNIPTIVSGSGIYIGTKANTASIAINSNGAIDMNYNLKVNGSVTATSFIGPFTGDVEGNAATASYATSAGSAKELRNATLKYAGYGTVGESPFNYFGDSGQISWIYGSEIGFWIGPYSGHATQRVFVKSDGDVIAGTRVAIGKGCSRDTVVNATLDVNGDAIFTGTVTASAFIGPFSGDVEGNAATASYATSAGSLTSKSIGNTTTPVYFDADGKPAACIANGMLSASDRAKLDYFLHDDGLAIQRYYLSSNILKTEDGIAYFCTGTYSSVDYHGLIFNFGREGIPLHVSGLWHEFIIDNPDEASNPIGLRIHNDANVSVPRKLAVGRIGTPQHTLHVVGDGYFTGTVTATAFVGPFTGDVEGNAATASYATSAGSLTSKSIGGSTTPVYFDADGKPVACTAYASASVNYATSAGKAAELVTAKKIELTSQDSSNAQIAFSRTGYNYITFPSSGHLAFATSASGAGIVASVSSTAFLPYTTNKFSLGTSSMVWSAVYATTFVGAWGGDAIPNSKLANSKVTVAGKDISLGGSLSAADLKAALGLGSLANLSSISASSITQGYLNTHPENAPIILPFINNDLAFLNKKGGSYKVYKTTSTNYTAASLSETAVTLSSGDNMFDGSPSYATISTTGEFVAVIDMTLHKLFSYSNVFYIDFGANQWRAKKVSVYVMNADTETAYTLKQTKEDLATGNWYASVSHTSTNASGSTVYGFNRLRVVLSGFNNPTSTSGKRIAQVGLLNYGSAGATETYISRGGCAGIYGSLVPHTTNSINLGSSSKKWANVYATTFTGALSGKATSAGTADSATYATSAGDAATLDGIDSTGFLRDISQNSVWASVDAIPLNLTPGIHRIHISGKEYSSILAGNDYTGAQWQMYFHPHASYVSSIKYRYSGATDWKTLLDSSNYSSYALPLTGGTLAGTSQNTPLTIKGTASGNDAWIAFHNNSGFLASLGVSADKKLKIYTNSASYNVWTAANQGSGSGLDADKLDGNEASAFAMADGSNASGTWGISISGNAGSADNSYYLFTQQQNNTSFYPNYKAYIKWIANDTASIKFTDGTYKFKADLAGSADDSAKLNGQEASYYATAASLASYLALDGSKTMTGAIKIAETKGILLRHTNTTYTAGIGYDTQGNECIAMWAKNAVTRLRWHAGTDMSGTTYQQMMSITPDFEISKADGTAKGYIGGSAIVTAANISSYVPSGGGSTADLSNYVVKNGTGVQCIGGGLVVGATSTSGVSAAAAGRIMITGHTNPLIGLLATGSSTPFYFQVTSDDIMYLGPTSTKALKFEASGNTTVQANFTATGSITGNLVNGITVFGKKYNNASEITVADTDLVSSTSEGTSDCTDGTEILTSWATDSGFNDSSGKNKLYRRKMSKVYNYIKGKLDSVYLGKTANAVNGTFYGVCDTAEATVAKTVTITGFPSTLTAGIQVTIKFTNKSGVASATLNVNGTGAKPIYRYGTTAVSTGTTTSGWVAGAVQTFTYDGTGWVREYWNNTTYSNVALGQGYATCSTAAATAAKTAALSSYALTANGIVSIKFTYDVPAGATLNINSKGAKAMYYKGAAITAGVIKAGDTATFIYNTYYHLISIDRLAETRVSISNETATSKSISPNVYYKWGTMSSLSITLATPSDSNVLNNYMFEFTASSSGCSLTMPTSIKWQNGSAPSIEAGKTYQVSIINNLAVASMFS